MKAFVIYALEKTRVDLLSGYESRTLLPLVDRPFVQHVVERLASTDVTACHFVVGEGSEQLRTLLGTGERWGVDCVFHEVADNRRPYHSLLASGFWDDGGEHLVVHGDRIPLCDLTGLAAGGESVVVEGGVGRPAWTGWGRLTRNVIEAAAEGVTWEEFADLVLATPHERIEAPEMLSLNSFEDLLSSQLLVIQQRTGLFLNGREPRGPGIRICRNVQIHPTAEIEGPVFLGDNVRIGKHVRLGPNTVIGDNSVVDRNTRIENSFVLPNTYVGEWLELSGCVAQQGEFVNTRHGAHVPVDDRFVLGAV